MLINIQSLSKNTFARVVVAILMFLLIASFALFGISDVFRGVSNRDVITVGKQSIGVEEFDQSYRAMLSRLSAGGQVVTPAMAREIGLDRQLLESTISDVVLDNRIHNLGLSLGPEGAAQLIQKDPTFFNPAGTFDAAGLQQYLQATRQTELSFVRERATTYLRRELTIGLFGSERAPNTLAAAEDRFNNEMRDVSYITLTDDKLPAIAPPDDATLQSYFEENKARFRTDDLRRFTYVYASPKEIAAGIEVSDADARSYYDGNVKQRYTKAEKRTVEQIAFPNAAEAKAAADKIAAGTDTFEAIATARKLAPADLVLGTFTRNEMIDPKVAEAAFTLPAGKASGVVEGQVSPVIIRITKIEPAAVTPFEAVKDTIKQSIAIQRASEEIASMTKQIDEAKLDGTPLATIAPKLGQPAVTVGNISAQGVDAEGKPVTLPFQTRLLAAVFQADPNGEIGTVDGRQDGVIWFSIDGEEPAHDRSLADVRNAVIAAWTESEKQSQLQARASELVKELNGGKTLDAVATEQGVGVQQAWNLKREGETQGLSTAAKSAAFATPVKGYGTSTAAAPGERVVFQVVARNIPAFDATTAASKDLSTRLGAAVQSDLLMQYVADARANVGVTINQANYDRVVGGSSEN